MNMAGSTFSDLLNMNGLEVKQSLLMNNMAHFVEVDLTGAKVGGQMNMAGSTFSGCLNMASLEVEQDLFMNDKAHFVEVDLVVARVRGQVLMTCSTFTGPLKMNGLKVGGQLVLTGSTFEKPLKMNSLEVKQSLMMCDGTRFPEVNLGSTKVGGTLEMTGSTFTGALNMNGLEVKQSLLMNNMAHFVEVDLTGAKVGGQMNMAGSTFSGCLNMEHIHIGLDLLMRKVIGPMEGRTVNLTFAEILGNLDISGSQLSSLDLTGTKIQSEFCLNPSPTWRSGARLILRNVEVGALQDNRNAWSEILYLNGFTYAQLGGLDPKGENPVTDRKVPWFCDWLKKQPGYSPQPYQQLASVLLNMGHRTESDGILYAGKERERESTHELRKKVWMTLLNWTIGYGYKTWRALVWAILFVVLGVLVLEFFAPNVGIGTLLDETFYSLNMLLPGVRLNIPHLIYPLPPCAQYYFYIQRVLGVILGSFLIAGLSGLTKK
ncbi:MAG: pentapeptide repeat-containing protein [Leptospirillum sp.]